MKRFILLIVCMAAFAIQLSAQEQTRTITKQEYINRIKNGGVDFVAPKGFAEPAITVTEESFDKNFESIHTSATFTPYILESANKNCIVFYGSPYKVFPFFCDSSYVAQRDKFLNGRYDTILKMTGSDNIDKYVSTISAQKAAQRFNADSLLLFDIPAKMYKADENYTHSMVLVIMKHPVLMECLVLLTDKGYKNKDKYLAQIDKTLWFSDKAEDIALRNQNPFKKPQAKGTPATLTNAKVQQKVLEAIKNQ